MSPELLTAIQEEASLAGLGHIFPADLYPFPREAVLERWRTATDTILADPGELGFAAVAPPWLDALYVRPAAWGTGVADRLHDRAVEALRAAGVETARLWVLEENRRARLWGAQIRFHAARLYSWMRPPRRSRRVTALGRVELAGPSVGCSGSGGVRLSARCGRWLL